MSAFVTSVAHIAAQAASFTPSISTSSTRQCSPLPCTRAAIQPPSSAAGGVVNTTDFDKLGNDWANASPSEKKTPTQVIDHALDTFPGTVAIAFSGAEDVVLIEYASRTNKPYRVFALDTGRLHPQTYRFYAQVEKHYAITIEYTFPETEQVTQLVNEKGLFSFYEDGHQECCRVRKVRPLRRKLATLSAWITGQRKDQSPGTRTDIPIVQVDPAFKGTNDSTLIKYNPLADVSSSQVWATIRASGVPYNALHQQGFISIGCEPCTRAVLPNQHEREGRWWWEQATQKECGLHKGNISLDGAAAELADDFVADMVGAHKVVAFTKKGCKYCKALDDLLLSLNVPYAQYVISEMDNCADVVAALERATGQNTAPNVFIGGKHIGGNEETQKLYKSGALLPLLQQADVNVSVS